MPEQHWSLANKILFSFLVVSIAAALGYLLMYQWIVQGWGARFDTSVLKDQVVAEERSREIQQQLRNLGYEFQDESFFQLRNPSSTHYKADALGGFEPEKIEDQQFIDEGYYFYDQDGLAYYFTVGPEGEVDPKKFIPLIQE